MDRKQLDEDVERLTAYYRGLGFFQARIGRELEFNEKENWVTVTFVIDEGARYKIRDVSVQGNKKYKNDELLGELKLKKSDYFNQAKLVADVQSIKDKYGGVGYVFADIKADPQFLPEAGQLDLVYNIKEGDRYAVAKINVKIKGEYPHTQLTTVLNRLSFRPGDIIDTRELRASERRLRASQLFEANPAMGNAPKIAYSLPGSDDQADDDTSKPHDDKDTPHSRRGGGMGRGMGGGMGGGMGRGMGGGAGSTDSDSVSDSGGTFRGQSPDSDPVRPLDVTLGDGNYVVTRDRNGVSGAPANRDGDCPAFSRKRG